MPLSDRGDLERDIRDATSSSCPAAAAAHGGWVIDSLVLSPCLGGDRDLDLDSMPTGVNAILSSARCRGASPCAASIGGRPCFVMHFVTVVGKGADNRRRRADLKLLADGDNSLFRDESSMAVSVLPPTIDDRGAAVDTLPWLLEHDAAAVGEPDLPRGTRVGLTDGRGEEPAAVLPMYIGGADNLLLRGGEKEHLRSSHPTGFTFSMPPYGS